MNRWSVSYQQPEELLDQQPRAPRYDPYNTELKSYDCSQTPLEKDDKKIL